MDKHAMGQTTVQIFSVFHKFFVIKLKTTVMTGKMALVG